MNVLMKCGHTAQGKDQNGNPACVICFGIDAGATVIDESPPDLSGRIAKCSYHATCGKERPSSLNLAFFEYHPDWDFDEYYCGCYGWD